MAEKTTDKQKIEAYCKHRNVTFVSKRKGVLTFNCPTHGKYKVEPRLKASQEIQRYIPWCQECGHESRAAGSTKHTTLSLKRLVRQNYGGKFGLDQVEYISYVAPIKLKCKTHGYFTTTINILNEDKPRKYLCDACWQQARSENVSIENIEQALLKQGRGVTIVKAPEVLRFRSLLTLNCPIHGHFQMLRESILVGGSCPCCYKDHKAFIGKRQVIVQGYERFVIPSIVRFAKTAGIGPSGIFEAKHPDVSKRPPKIYYRLNGEQRSHYPDFWIPKMKTIIEVKSTWTAGISPRNSDPELQKQLRQKKKYAERKGFRYIALIHVPATATSRSKTYEWK